VYVLTSATPVLSINGDVVMGLSLNVDITERKLAEQGERELDRHKRDFYRRTILAATDGRLVIAERHEIEQLAGSPIRTWEIVKGEQLGVVRHEAMEIAESFGMDESRVFDFVLAVGEMSTNALKHAGSGQASLHKQHDELIFVVSDHGPGIEAVTLPEVALVRGYSTAGTLGMGYKAVLSVADRVYLATGPSGTTVAVEMSLHAVERLTAIPDTWVKQR
jgi:anti-sigma regulatory factor (Ser/Thr protein kinase)